MSQSLQDPLHPCNETSVPDSTPSTPETTDDECDQNNNPTIDSVYTKCPASTCVSSCHTSNDESPEFEFEENDMQWQLTETIYVDDAYCTANINCEDMYSIENSSVCNIDESKETAEWNGFKLVGDNIDKNFKPRYMTSDRQTKSLHFFHSYAVKDRINLSGISDVQSRPQFDDDSDYAIVLPSAGFNKQLDYIDSSCNSYAFF